MDSSVSKKLASTKSEVSRILGAGEMATLVRSYDWSSTSLGPISCWSAELVTIVNLTLCTPSPARAMWGSDFILIYNDAYIPIPGPRHPEALGKSARVVYRESWHVVGPLLEEAFLTGRTLFHEKLLVPLPTRNGVRDFYLNYSFNPIFEDGKTAGLFGPLQDVSGEVAAVQQLRESEARANRILLSIGDAVIVTDAQTRVTMMNPIAEALTGWSLSEAHGWPVAEIFVIINEKTRQSVESPMNEVRHSGTVAGLASQTVLVSRDKTVSHIDDSAAPVRDEQGNLNGIVLVFRSVDDRRIVEQEKERLQSELERKYSELSGIYETSSIALAMIDPSDFRYLRGNSKLAAILGIPIDQVVGTPVFELANDVSALRDALVSAAAGVPVLGKVIEGELANDPGTHRSWQVEYIPVFAADGRVEVIAASSIEITAERKAQAALIQNEKLAAVGRLAASISHEINNPLESVTNLLYLARGGQDIAEIVEYIRVAEQELSRVTAITTQTLRFHRQSTKPSPVFCDTLIDESLSIYQARIINLGIVIARRMRSTRPVFCFEGEIRQVLSNLISNAVDAMQRHGGHLLLRSREATKWSNATNGIMLTIADTGGGMSPQIPLKVFEPFFTTKGDNGTGLGLWVSHQIVERHHGTLKVRSSQNVKNPGTVFTLFLPLDAAQPRTRDAFAG